MNLQHTHKCCSLFTIQPKVQADMRTFSQARSRQYLEIKMTKYYTMFTPQTLRTGGVSFFL